MIVAAPEGAQVGKVHTAELEVTYFEQGEGPLLIALHGFPDTPHTFRHQLGPLAKAGYRVVAPFLRGYPPTSIPHEGDYSALRIARDVLDLMDALGERSATLVAHDWGAIAAYTASVLAPERVERLVTMAVPHQKAVQDRVSLRQLRRSWYVFFFQLGRIADVIVRLDDLAFIDHLWRHFSPTWDFSTHDIEPTKATLREPGALEAALGYYRAAFKPSAFSSEVRKVLLAPITVPTLVLSGSEDGAMGPEMFEGGESYFAAEYRHERVVGAGHFLQLERPERVNELLLEFLSLPGGDQVTRRVER